MKRAILVVVAVAAAALAAGCEQCLIRPCGFCYDSVITAAAPQQPAALEVPPAAPRTAAMTR